MRQRFISTNPMLRSIDNSVFDSTESATYNGIALKTLFLFAVLITSAFTVVTNLPYFEANFWIFFVALIGGFIAVITASIKPKLAKYFAPIYAVFEGIVIGVIATMLSFIASGIVEIAILITLCIFFVMLILYITGAVRVGPFLRRLTIGALVGLLMFTLLVMFSSVFSPAIANMYYSNLSFMLVISLVSAVIATLMILLDLDNCTRIVQAGAPKEFEWSASLGLMVTIIWLFIEILRILFIFTMRRD